MVTSNNIEQMADSAGLGARGVGENGVDRAQIREMLKLTPSERLRRVQEFTESEARARPAEDGHTTP